MQKLFFSFLFISLLFGCTNKKNAPELVYTIEELNQILDSSGVTTDKTPANAINFSDYAPGVDRNNSKPLVYQRLSFAAIKFDSEKEAKQEALRLNQYYSRNILFDKVEGEPVLEDLVILKFEALNPKRTIQRKPVMPLK